MKNILVFKNGELLNQFSYRSKAVAKKQYNFFVKNGILDPNTGLKIENTIFELI